MTPKLLLQNIFCGLFRNIKRSIRLSRYLLFETVSYYFYSLLNSISSVHGWICCTQLIFPEFADAEKSGFAWQNVKPQSVVLSNIASSWLYLMTHLTRRNILKVVEYWLCMYVLYYITTENKTQIILQNM